MRERERERYVTVFVSGHDSSFRPSGLLQSDESRTIWSLWTSLCEECRASQPPVVAIGSTVIVADGLVEMLFGDVGAIRPYISGWLTTH